MIEVIEVAIPTGPLFSFRCLPSPVNDARWTVANLAGLPGVNLRIAPPRYRSIYRYLRRFIVRVGPTSPLLRSPHLTPDGTRCQYVTTAAGPTPLFQPQVQNGNNLYRNSLQSPPGSLPLSNPSYPGRSSSSGAVAIPAGLSLSLQPLLALLCRCSLISRKPCQIPFLFSPRSGLSHGNPVGSSQSLPGSPCLFNHVRWFGRPTRCAVAIPAGLSLSLQHQSSFAA